MRRLLIVAAALALVLGGVLAAYVIHRLHQSADERGSTSTEYITTQTTEARPPAAVPWPTYGFSPDRTRSAQLALRPPFRVVWRYQAGSLIEFPPAIGYDRLFFSTNKGTFAAVSEKTGKYAWKYRAHRCVAASPAIGPHAHGTVYEAFLNRPPCNAQNGGHGVNGEVIAFGVGHGKIHWRHTIGPSESSPLLVEGPAVRRRLERGRLGVRRESRARRVAHACIAHAAIKGALAYAGGHLFVGAYDGHVYCISRCGPRDLEGLCTTAALRRVGLLLDARGRVRPRLHRLDRRQGVRVRRASGHRLWSHSTGGYVYASPAVWRQRILVGSYSGRFTAFDAGTGEPDWAFKAGGPISGSAVVVGNVVYFATLHEKHLKNGRTYALDARTGKELWSFPDGKYTPVVAAGSKLFLIGYGVVYGMVEKR